MTGTFVNAGSGASPVLQPFIQPTKTPKEGPSYIVVAMTLLAGATKGTAEFNPQGAGMSQIASVVINATDVATPSKVSFGQNFSWRVAANGFLTAPAYWSGGLVYLSAEIDSPLIYDATFQIALFNIEQTPTAAASDITVNGAVQANITNADLPISGNVNASITNASLNVTGGVNATVLNASLNIKGTQGAGAQVEVTPSKLGPFAMNNLFTLATYPTLTPINLSAYTTAQLMFFSASANNTSPVQVYMYNTPTASYLQFDVMNAADYRYWGNSGGVILGGNPDTLLLAATSSGTAQQLRVTIWNYP